MDKKYNYFNLKYVLKIICFIALISTQVGYVYAQDVETEKAEKNKKKEKKNSGKIKVNDKKAEIVKYRRSSLHTIIIEDVKLPDSEIILKTFNEADFPEKYNNHTVDGKSFDINLYNEFSDTGIEDASNNKKDKDLSPFINKYLIENKVATSLVAKWFSRSRDGDFNMSLIQERGMYDASSQDASVASTTERGIDQLKDAGEELIPNTFVVVNYSKFVNNEIAAAIIRDVAIIAASESAMAEIIELTANALYEKTKDGYTVFTTAYLYKLDWNDSVAAVFYQSMWMGESSIDPDKKEMFDNTDLFKLKLLGFQKARSLITGLGENAKDKDMIIKNATLKSIDAVYSKLQKKFESFRTKTPLVSSNPIGAKIGMKEGLTKRSKFEVLEQTQDENGKLVYKRKGKIKVKKGMIWDNRFNAGEEQLDEDGNIIKPENDLKYTIFKGSKKKYYPGMLIRQIK